VKLICSASCVNLNVKVRCSNEAACIQAGRDEHASVRLLDKMSRFKDANLEMQPWVCA
jgi:hypothetical protein